MLPCRVLALLSLLIRGLLASLRSRRDIALENLVLRQQLQVALRTNPSPQLTNSDRVLWVWLRHALKGGKRRSRQHPQSWSLFRRCDSGLASTHEFNRKEVSRGLARQVKFAPELAVQIPGVAMFQAAIG